MDSHALPGSPAGLPAGTCLLLTTSGSTGVPKIVPLETAAVTRFCTWAAGAFALGERRVLNYAPLNFDLCLLDIWATLSHGGCTVLVDPAFAGYPPHLLRLFAETEPQVVQGVPMLFRLLTGGDGEVEFPSVRTVLLTGDHTPLPLRRRLVRAFPEALFHNVYGCTETNDSFIHTFGAEEAAGREVLPLGRPLPGVAAAVLAGGRMLDGAGTGELVVSTPFQTAGYLGQDNSRFFRGTFDAALGERAWYRTGDLVARDADGALSLVGRNDFQVKVRGVRVNLEEIEQVLASHADVGEAAVVPLPDDEAGVRLHAVVRPVRDGLSSLRLRAYCADRLTRAAIPTGFSMTDEPLPTGPTGKVHRGRIRDRLVRELT